MRSSGFRAPARTVGRQGAKRTSRAVAVRAALLDSTSTSCLASRSSSSSARILRSGSPHRAERVALPKSQQTAGTWIRPGLPANPLQEDARLQPRWASCASMARNLKKWGINTENAEGLPRGEYGTRFVRNSRTGEITQGIQPRVCGTAHSITGQESHPGSEGRCGHDPTDSDTLVGHPIGPSITARSATAIA